MKMIFTLKNNIKINNFINRIRSILGLSYQLAKSEFKLKNEGSWLGYIWYALDPLFTFLIFFFMRGVFRGGKDPQYGLYLIIGLIVFNLFNHMCSNATKAIIKNQNFLKTTNLNKEVFVITGIVSRIFSHIFEIFILIIFFLFFSVEIWKIYFYFLVLIPYLLFNIGIAFMLATAGAYVVDISNVWRIISRLLLFSTSIFYTLEPGELLYKINMYNPLYHFINTTRNYIMSNTLPSPSLIFNLTLFSFLIFIVGIYIFKRNEHKFTELI